ncbi:MAG: NAD-dependent epimerase/dehydratase family protein [bacterium]|nr:NAD-dependent epimerase/dehydratase family protein [bacterium]
MNLVTGATDILGSHVVYTLLSKGELVTAARQKNSNLKRTELLFSYYTPNYHELFSKIKWVEMDVCDIFSIDDALDGVSNVYHCAGMVSFDRKDRKKLMDINETGTRNIVNACLNKSGINLCHVSSIATVNNLDHKTMLDESVFWKTSGSESDYAISKYNAEREVWRGIEEGLNAVIVNPGVILGPGFWTQSSGRLFSAGYRGYKFFTKGRAAYVGAMDVASIMHQLMLERHFGNRYILVEDNYPIAEVFSRINEGFGHKGPTIQVGRHLLNLALLMEKFWKMLSRGERTLSKALVNAAFSQQNFSNKKIKETLRVDFRPTAQVIEETCKLCLLEGRKGPKP